MEPQPRRWFQMNLSTALILMIWFSAFIGLNVRETVRPFDDARDFAGTVRSIERLPDTTIEQGWPHAFRIQWTDKTDSAQYPVRFYTKRLIMDVFAGIAIGAALVVVLGWRRRIGNDGRDTSAHEAA